MTVMCGDQSSGTVQPRDLCAGLGEVLVQAAVQGVDGVVADDGDVEARAKGCASRPQPIAVSADREGWGVAHHGADDRLHRCHVEASEGQQRHVREIGRQVIGGVHNLRHLGRQRSHRHVVVAVERQDHVLHAQRYRYPRASVSA